MTEIRPATDAAEQQNEALPPSDINGPADVTWCPDDFPKLIFSVWNVASDPPAFYVAATLPDPSKKPPPHLPGQPFLQVELNTSRPSVPFSLRDKTGSKPNISGQLDYSMKGETAYLTVTDLRYPGGSIDSQTIEAIQTKSSAAYGSLEGSGSGEIPCMPIPGNNPMPAPGHTKVSPFWFPGRLKMSFGSKNFIGTGTLIAAKEDDSTGLFVLTCAHNLYDSKLGRATRITFQRGLNGQEDPPYAEIEAEDWFYPDGYRPVALSNAVSADDIGESLLHQSIAQDYGLVKLKKQIKLRTAPQLVSLGKSKLENMEVQLIGLYGWQNHDDHMYVGTGKIDRVTDTTLGYPISTDYGSSGTAIMRSPTEDPPQIVGVHVRRGPVGDDRNYGVRLTSSVIKTIEGWQQ